MPISLSHKLQDCRHACLIESFSLHCFFEICSHINGYLSLHNNPSFIGFEIGFIV